MNSYFDSNLSRRALLKTFGVTGAALGAGSVLSSPLLGAATFKTSNKDNKNPWIYAFTIGDVEAWSISDGFLDIRAGLSIMYPESERGEMKLLLEQHLEQTDSLHMYINILVLRRDKEVIVFDAGFGIVDNPNRGWLIEGLQTVGINRMDVTAAFLSHTHGDHMAGFIAPDETPMFPNAAIYTTPEVTSSGCRPRMTFPAPSAIRKRWFAWLRRLRCVSNCSRGRSNTRRQAPSFSADW